MTGVLILSGVDTRSEFIYIQFYDSMFILKLHAATFTMNLTAEGSWGMIRNYFTGREGVHIYDI